MNVQPTVIINIATAGLSNLVGKRKWAKAFKDTCEVAEQRSAKDFMENSGSNYPRHFKNV